MLVISSATNLLIYCSLSSTYRKEVLYFFSQTYSSIKAKIYKTWVERQTAMLGYVVTKCDVIKWLVNIQPYNFEYQWERS